EYLENYSNEIAASNSNQEKEKPPQDSDICQLIREECCIEVCKKQKQNMENTMLELVEVYCQKELHCMHDNVDDLIESALNSKLLSIYLESQRLDKKKQEVKNIVEQPTKRKTRIDKSLQNFRVVHKKSSISLNNTSQISPVHAITPILPTKEPEYSFSKGDDESLPDEDVLIEEFKVYSNPLFDDDEINSDKIDPYCFNAESDLIESLLNRDTLIDSSPKFDFLLKEFSGELDHINLILPEIKEADFDLESLFPSPIPVEDSDSLMDEIDLFLTTDDLLPPRIESDGYDSEGDIHFLEELLVDDSIPLLKNESYNFDYHDDSSFPRPPSKPPNVEYDSFCFEIEPNSREVISAVMNNIDELNKDECFDPRGEIDIFENIEDEDYFPFIFVIQIFLSYLIYPEPPAVAGHPPPQFAAARKLFRRAFRPKPKTLPFTRSTRSTTPLATTRRHAPPLRPYSTAATATHLHHHLVATAAIAETTSIQPPPPPTPSLTSTTTTTSSTVAPPSCHHHQHRHDPVTTTGSVWFCYRD
nr:hypothetical protein [Tanacetum cinerariifolium]